jgi:hypothetical protein
MCFAEYRFGSRQRFGSASTSLMDTEWPGVPPAGAAPASHRKWLPASEARSLLSASGKSESMTGWLFVE